MKTIASLFTVMAALWYMVEGVFLGDVRALDPEVSIFEYYRPTSEVVSDFEETLDRSESSVAEAKRELDWTREAIERRYDDREFVADLRDFLLNDPASVDILANVLDKNAAQAEHSFDDLMSDYVDNETAVNYILDKVQQAKNIRKAIVSYSYQFQGSRYVWGGMTPQQGFDCSGFVHYVYGKHAYSLPRVSKEMALGGVEVRKDELQYGDLLFFRDITGRGGIGHVGIVITAPGEPVQFIHASGRRTGVKISSFERAYYQERFITARRYVVSESRDALIAIADLLRAQS
ncbi:MAG: hypothetical protein GF419_00125 [Ignavibacteriales bacterium]|nr:hypothetical protein [Ignavibacteriales bacterium]